MNELLEQIVRIRLNKLCLADPKGLISDINNTCVRAMDYKYNYIHIYYDNKNNLIYIRPRLTSRKCFSTYCLHIINIKETLRMYTINNILE